jgi:hypothetical protein
LIRSWRPDACPYPSWQNDQQFGKVALFSTAAAGGGCGKPLTQLFSFGKTIRFNPIEPCWSVVKQHLRRLKARSLAALDQVITFSLALIYPAIALNCFAHSGYALY